MSDVPLKDLSDDVITAQIEATLASRREAALADPPDNASLKTSHPRLMALIAERLRRSKK